MYPSFSMRSNNAELCTLELRKHAAVVASETRTCRRQNEKPIINREQLERLRARKRTTRPPLFQHVIFHVRDFVFVSRIHPQTKTFL